MNKKIRVNKQESEKAGTYLHNSRASVFVVVIILTVKLFNGAIFPSICSIVRYESEYNQGFTCWQFYLEGSFDTLWRQAKLTFDRQNHHAKTMLFFKSQTHVRPKGARIGSTDWSECTPSWGELSCTRSWSSGRMGEKIIWLSQFVDTFLTSDWVYVKCTYSIFNGLTDFLFLFFWFVSMNSYKKKGHWYSRHWFFYSLNMFLYSHYRIVVTRTNKNKQTCLTLTPPSIGCDMPSSILMFGMPL